MTTPTPPHFDFDLIVIGAGSGGVRAARMAAGFGARVAICEAGRVGGTCVNVGCIPKKLYVYASQYREAFEDARAYGWHSEPPPFSWATLLEAKDREIERLNGIYRELLERAGVTLVQGRALLAGPHEVRVGKEVLRGERILLAVGSKPHLPVFEGRELVQTSDAFFAMRAQPERVIVLGGGYIALELAGILNACGSRVSLCFRAGLPLRGFDQDVRSFVGAELGKKGIAVRGEHEVQRVERRPEGYIVHFHNQPPQEADLVIAALGREAHTAGLGLEALGVQTDPVGAIVVDDEFRTSVPSVFALGDVINRMQLTPVAIAEAMAFARTHFGGTPEGAEYEFVPTAVFSQPPVATVGWTEEEARARVGAIRVFRSAFRPLRHTVSGRDERTLMKLVVDAASDRVLGCHMVGADAAEILQGFAVALRCGATKAQFDRTVGIHPSAAEEFVTMRTPVPSPQP